MRRLITLLCACLALIGQSAVAQTWRIDQSQTRIFADVLYLGEATLGVEFKRFNSAIRFDEYDLDQTRAEIAVAASSVHTGYPWIDALVRSKDFLDARQHPGIRFRLTRLEKTSQSTADIDGNVTLLGVTRPISFKADVFRYGYRADAPKVKEAGFNLRGEIDRRDFGNATGYPQIAAKLPLRIRLVLTTADAS